MASLDKLLGKIEKAQSAIKSFKGTVSKFKNLNFNSLVDELAEQKGLANSILDARRSSLQRQLSAKNTSKRACKGLPDENTKDFMYPQDLDFHENYITFRSRPRQLQSLSDGTTESKSGILGRSAEFEVHLYIPDTLLSQANVQYKQESMGGINRVVTDLITDPGSLGGTGTKEALANTALSTAVKFASTLSGGGVEARAGIAINPMKEMMFEGIGFRSWNFTYEFYPRSNWEAAEINHIIYAFRTAMLPDTFNFDMFDESGESSQRFQDQFFNYPNIFDISFNGPIKDRVDGFLPAVCTKCDVDHTGGQKFSVYEDGQPVKSTMTLEFMEIRLMTQNNYQALSPVSNKGGLLKSNDSSVMEGDRTTLGDVKNNYIELGTKAKAKIDNLFGGGD
jgi:hypothetical protein